MKPKELILHNIGPFEGTHTIHFGEFDSIFLICGQTGAGKTTLFDGLAYAFYGKPLGYRAGFTKNMRSHFALEHEPSFVIVLFYIGSNLYRITRYLPYTKKSHKTETPEEVLLEEYINETWQNISSVNKRETDTAIKNLIKLSENEFSRIVLLPQGEFSRFLRANSSEKKETLLNLFPVTRYTQLMQNIKKHAERLSQETSAIEQALESLCKHFTAASYSNDIEEVSNAVTNARRELKIMLESIKNKTTEMEQQKILNKKRHLYHTRCAELESLHNRESEIHRLREKITAAQRALPLAVAVRQLTEIETAINHEQHALSEQLQLFSTVTELLAALDTKKTTMAEHETLKNTLTAAIAALKKAVVSEKEIAKEQICLTSLQQKTNAADSKLSNTTAQIEIKQKELHHLQHDIDTLEKRHIVYEQLKEQLTVEKTLAAAQNVLVEKQALLQQQKTKIHLLGKKLAETLKDICINTEQIAILETQKHNAERQHGAALLAQTLEQGGPCPVCGAKEHPLPAVPPSESAFSFNERIQSESRNAEKLQKSKEKTQKDLASAEAALQNYEIQVQEQHSLCKTLRQQHTLCVLPDNNGINLSSPPNGTSTKKKVFPNTKEEAAFHIAETAKQTELATLHYNTSCKALNKQKSIQDAIELLRQEHAHILAEKNDCETQVSIMQNSIDEKIRQLQDTYGLLPKDIAPQNNARATMETCLDRLKELTTELTDYTKHYTEALQSKERLAGSISAAKTQLETQQHLFTRKKAETEQLCLQEGFESLEELEHSLYSEQDIAEWLAEIKQHESQMIACAETVSRLNEELSEKEQVDIAALSEQVRILNHTYSKQQEVLEQLCTKKVQLEEKYNQYISLTQQLVQKTTEAQHAISLSNDINGSNSRRLQFDTWILSNFLHEITVFANKRLFRMSEGRFRLSINEEQGSGNNYRGLDLLVSDAYTGKNRPSASLSGGETFMASISLALGLADSIQSRAGGIHIDAMFIDEGFGSLDEKALENAINILDEIRGNRMVGIISHVSELQNRIPQKIEVIKTGTGSYIKQ